MGWATIAFVGLGLRSLRLKNQAGALIWLCFAFYFDAATLIARLIARPIQDLAALLG